MKKLSKLFAGGMVGLACFMMGINLLGCKTMPAGKIVDPINLLDEKSDFYLAIPKKADPQLVDRIVNKNIPGLPQKNVDMICDRTTKIYSGITRNRTETIVQSAIEGTIPTSLIPKLLTKKNGWEVKDFMADGAVIPHTIYNANGLDVSFPAQNVVCVGRDMAYMLNKHDLLSVIPADIPEVSAPVDEYFSDLPRPVYDYLKGADEEIRFYANNPLSFLTLLVGRKLDLRLIEVKGSFRVDPSCDDQYILDIYFNFKENKFLKVGKALINLAFGLSNSTSELIGDTGLQVNGIKIGKDRLYKILVI